MPYRLATPQYIHDNRIDYISKIENNQDTRIKRAVFCFKKPILTSIIFKCNNRESLLKNATHNKKRGFVKMKCPNCSSKKVSVNSAHGYTPPDSPVKECAGCGLIWRLVPGEEERMKVDVIKAGAIRDSNQCAEVMCAA